MRLTRRRALAVAGAGLLTGAMAPAQRRMLLSRSALGPSLDLNLLGPTLDQRLTFTRASSATYYDSTGTVQTSASNTPRFDYDPVTHVAKGLLIEEQRTNYLPNSGSMLGSWWSVVNSSRPANAVVAPDGSSTVSFVVEDTSNNTHGMQANWAPTAGTTYCLSVFAKAGARTAIAAGGLGLNASGDYPGWDLTSGSVITVGNTNIVGQGIIPCGNGWYRCWISFNATSAAVPQWLLLNSNNAQSGLIYTGDGASGLYMWGGGVEVGSFPTSYIPTSGAAATRAADVCVMPVGPWFRQGGPGTLVSEWELEGLRRRPTITALRRHPG